MYMEPSYSPWGEVDHCDCLLAGVYSVSTPSHGGIMVRSDVVGQLLSKDAQKCGFREDGYLCFEEDCDELVALREFLDKGLIDTLPGSHLSHEELVRIVDEGVQRWHPEYWKAREKQLPSKHKAQDMPEDKRQTLALCDSLANLSKSEFFNVAFYMSYLLEKAEPNEPLTTDEAYVLAVKFHEAYGSWVAQPLLMEEYLDGIRYLLENGINARCPEFPELSPEDTRKLLLSADNQVFGTIVEVTATNNVLFFEPVPGDMGIDDVIPVITAAKSKKQPLADKIADAQEKGKANQPSEKTIISEPAR